MDELFEAIEDFLKQARAADTDPDIELYYEPDCPLCAEDGFDFCQGHPYSEDGGFFLG